MPETRSRALDKILERGDSPKGFTEERQLTAQSFNLHVAWRDGLRTEGFAWSHYAGYQWKDEGSHEKLVVIFGGRALEIEGHHLGVLVEKIREGQLNGIREMVSSQATLLKQENPENEPIISSVKTYPDFEEVLKEIKGDGERDTGFAGKIGR